MVDLAGFFLPPTGFSGNTDSYVVKFPVAVRTPWTAKGIGGCLVATYWDTSIIHT